MEEFVKKAFPLDLQLFADDGEGSEEEVEDDEETEDDEEEEKEKEKTFTQKEVNRLASKEKRQGRIAALKALGIDPKNKEQVAKAKELLKGLNSNGKEDKSSEQKEDNKIALEADRKLFEADCKIKAIELGAKPTCVNDIVILVAAKMNEGDEIEDVMQEVKEAHPSMFGKTSNNEDEKDDDEKEETEEKKKRRGTGKSLGDFKKNSMKKNNSKSLGESLAKMGRAKKAKKSMFD